MPISDRVPWETLERWRAVVFFASGLAWFLMALLNHYELEYTQDPLLFAWLTEPLLVGGAIGVMIAMLGFYPLIKDEMPRLTGATAILLGLGVLSWIWYVVGNTLEWFIVAQRSGTFGSTTTVADYPWLVVLLSIMLGFLIFSVACLRSGARLRIEGVVMLLPFLAILVHAASGNFIDMPDPVLLEWAVMGVVMLILGYRLRSGSVPRATALQTNP